MTTNAEITEAIRRIRLAEFDASIDILQDLINDCVNKAMSRPVIITNESNGIMRLENKGHVTIVTIKDKNIR